MPMPPNSSLIFGSMPGWKTSSSIRTRSAFLATASTSLPLPLPSFAPTMIPGRSRSCIFAPLYSITPGMQVSVVKA